MSLKSAVLCCQTSGREAEVLCFIRFKPSRKSVLEGKESYICMARSVQGMNFNIFNLSETQIMLQFCICICNVSKCLLGISVPATSN